MRIPGQLMLCWQKAKQFLQQQKTISFHGGTDLRIEMLS